MTPTLDASPFRRTIDRVHLRLVVDCLAVATVVALPWSTSAAIILIVVWLVGFLLTHDVASIRRELETAAGFLPVLLWLLAVVGMLWSEAGWAERLAGLGGFHKLLVIPLLLTQFRRSEGGMWVLYGFLASCSLLMLASTVTFALWVLAPDHGFYVANKQPGILVRDYIAQSVEFLICVFALLPVAFDAARDKKRTLAIGAAILAAMFFGNIFVVATSRTTLVVFAGLALLFGFRQNRWIGALVAGVAVAVLYSGFFFASSMLRDRVTLTVSDLREYGETRESPGNADKRTAPPNTSGIRLELWSQSLHFLADAPIIGHGTGSIPEMFRREAAPESDPDVARDESA